MAATLKKVRQTNDKNFTIRDLIDIYSGKKEYAKYDKSSCQWNYLIQNAAYNGTDFMPFSKPKFLDDTLMEYAGLNLLTKILRLFD